MKKIIIAVIAVAFIIILAGSGAWYLQNSRKPYEGKTESIVVGMSSLLDSSALIIIADDQRFFADNGLNVTIKNYATGSDSVDNLLKGDNDIAVATEFIIVKNSFNKENIIGIGSIARSEDHYLIIGRNDRGVENVSDLVGKKIGVPRGTVGDFYLGRFLELHGISLRDVTVVDVPPAQSVDAIGNGTVDAILIWKPFTDTIIDQLGTNGINWPAQSSQLAYWNAICKDDWAAQNPELINRFLKSVDQAAKYSIYHPAEAKAILQKRLHSDDDYIESAWAGTQFSLTLDQSLITAMEDEGRWMINNNLTAEKTIPDYRDYLYLKGLDEVKPESVNIIR